MFDISFSRKSVITLFGGLLLFASYQEASSQKAARFDSTGDYIEVPHAASLAPSQLTIELWLKVHGLGGPEMGGEQVILDKRVGTAGCVFRRKLPPIPEESLPLSFSNISLQYTKYRWQFSPGIDFFLIFSWILRPRRFYMHYVSNDRRSHRPQSGWKLYHASF